MEDNSLSSFFEKHSPRWNQGQPLDNFAVFLGKKLYSHNVFIHPGVQIGNTKLRGKTDECIWGGWGRLYLGLCRSLTHKAIGTNNHTHNRLNMLITSWSPLRLFCVTSKELVTTKYKLQSCR